MGEGEKERDGETKWKVGFGGIEAFSEMNIDEAKREMRGRMRGVRAGVHDSERVCGLLAGVIEGARVVVGYLAIGSEIDVRGAIAGFAGRVGLVRVDWDSGEMDVAAVEKLSLTGRDVDELEVTRHGVVQPKAALAAISLREVDVVLVPGLAFDARGGRLGRGGGFYDRFLTKLRRENFGCRVVGVCLEEQVVDIVPFDDAQDVRVDMIVTPARVIACV